VAAPRALAASTSAQRTAASLGWMCRWARAACAGRSCTWSGFQAEGGDDEVGIARTPRHDYARVRAAPRQCASIGCHTWLNTGQGEASTSQLPRQSRAVCPRRIGHWRSGLRSRSVSPNLAEMIANWPNYDRDRPRLLSADLQAQPRSRRDPSRRLVSDRSGVRAPAAALRQVLGPPNRRELRSSRRGLHARAANTAGSLNTNAAAGIATRHRRGPRASPAVRNDPNPPEAREGHFARGKLIPH
jgi:hypothetical protein